MAFFIHIKSEKFPILPDEKDQLVNEGTYGKALAEYIQANLKKKGYDVPFVCCEDWGWWVQISSVPFTFGVCIYCKSESETPTEFVCSDGAPAEKAWNWKKFQFVRTEPWITKLRNDLTEIFNADSSIELAGVSDEFPF